MALTDATKQWLMTELGYIPEELATLSEKDQGRLEKAHKGYLRQDDYSRQMNEFRTLQTQVADKDAQLTREYAEWAELKGQDQDAASTLRTQLEQTRVEAFQLKERLQTLAVEHGLDPKTVVPPLTQTPETDPAKPGPGKTGTAAGLDPERFISREQLAPIVLELFKSPAELYAITQEHQALTGKPLTKAEADGLVAEFTTRVANRKAATLTQVWEETFQIPEKRTASEQVAHTAELQAAEQRGFERARSEAALPGQHAPGHAAPVFTRLRPDGSAPKLAKEQPGTGTRSAAAALASHKYAGDGKAPGNRA